MAPWKVGNERRCQIDECRALILGNSYWKMVLDDPQTGPVVGICPSCKRKCDQLKRSLASVPN